MSAIVCLELSVVLWIAHVLVQGAFGNIALPAGYLFTSRDAPPPVKGVMFGRATRALGNYIENLTPFVALDLGLIVTHHAAGFGPTLWIVCRIIYIPLYLFGVVYARTAIWMVSVVALIMMLSRLAF